MYCQIDGENREWFECIGVQNQFHIFIYKDTTNGGPKK